MHGSGSFTFDCLPPNIEASAELSLFVFILPSQSKGYHGVREEGRASPLSPVESVVLLVVRVSLLCVCIARCPPC